MNSAIYEMIIFDWDGTAVPDRHAPIGALKEALEQLLGEGALCAIVTGTKLENIIKQGVGDLSPLAKHGLHVCANRGSEVYDFDPEGRPQLIYRRQATAAENDALDRTAIQLRDHVKTQGLRTEIIFNRLNRRKVDLIPEPEWFSPKKAQFRELLSAVESRMRDAGLAGGIPTLLDLSEKLAHVEGLSSPRITSDIKHIEIGLTDKGDSATWIANSIILPGKIPVSKVSVWGDELGSLGALPGSDALMRVPELLGASFFSVGVEPEGVPDWVNHLGGGPHRFVEFLLDQARLRRVGREARNLPALEPSKDPTWILEQVGFDPSHERLMETLFAISNGNLGVRGSSDLPVPSAQADLFIAGIYDQRAPSQPYSEVQLFDSADASKSPEAEIVPIPFPFRFRARVDGTSILAANVKRLEYRRCLDLQKGVYFEQNLLESNQGQKTRLSSFRICSHIDPNLLIQKMTFGSDNYSGQVELDLSLYPDDFAELYPHLRAVKERDPTDPPLSDCQIFSTAGSKDFITLASRITVNGRRLRSSRIQAHLSPGHSLEIERRVSVFWSKRAGTSSGMAIAHSKALPKTLALDIEPHVEAWKRFWFQSDLDLPQAPGPTDALRFSLYHLRSCAALAPQASIPAKGLTGRAYEGHIFWDTEIFILPFFLYTDPAIARSLLLYRYKTLPGAKLRAARMGLRGACYAWESTATGQDVTPSSISISGKDSKSDSTIPIFTGTQELHITADVAWAVCKYWDATLDHAFMCDFGAEILIETARFWNSRVALYGDRFHLKGIVGPDEYHSGVTDNAFTNWMVRFNLEMAIKMVSWLEQEYPKEFATLSSRLNLSRDEVTAWQDRFKRLFVPQPNENGVIEQFEGFFALKSIELPEGDKTRAPISRLFDWKETNKTRIVKQADVLMIPFLFPDALSPSVIKANYDYYEPITDHGSSLSPCVHGAIAARIGKTDAALRYWRESLYFDLHNTMSNSQLGIHAAALGGTWQALVFHLLGLRPKDTGFSFDRTALRSIPKEWNGLKLKLKYRSRTYLLALDSGNLVEVSTPSSREAA